MLRLDFEADINVIAVVFQFPGPSIPDHVGKKQDFGIEMIATICCTGNPNDVWGFNLVHAAVDH